MQRPSESVQTSSILIGGQALGAPASTGAHYGLVAEQVGSLSVGGTAYRLHAGPSNEGPPLANFVERPTCQKTCRLNIWIGRSSPTRSQTLMVGISNCR
jgi:hypothetical protein